MKHLGKFFAVIALVAFFGSVSAYAGESCCPMSKDGMEGKKCEKGQCKTNFTPKNRKASPDGMNAK